MGHANHTGGQRLLLRRQASGHGDVAEPDAAALFDHQMCIRDSLPAVLTWLIAIPLRKWGWIKDGDLKLDL